MLLSSAYLTKRCPRRSSSRSSSSSTRLLSSGESGPPWGVPSTLGLTSPFSITPAFKNARMSFSSRLSSTRLADLPHQFVVINSIEKFFQIEVNHPAVAFGNVPLRLSHRLMGGSSRSKTIAVVGERRVPPPLQHLHHRLLDKPIQHRRDAKLWHPAVRFGDFYPPHRLWFVGSVQQ